MSQGRVLTRTEASESAIGMRADGLTVVFTNGCFDLLHPGHLHILRAARSLGDFLMVGVNTDASVGRLKGPGRPLIPLAARMDLLAELRCVDGVVPFDEDTPMELIREVRPAVLVKGGDYSPGTVVGADLVASLGGRVVIVPLLSGYSTTSLAEAIPGPVRCNIDPLQGGGGS